MRRRDQQPDPFREQNVRRDGLRELKRTAVKLGNSGNRTSLELARWLFQEVSGLKEA